MPFTTAHSAASPASAFAASPTPSFGLIVVGDEILSGKNTDKHFPQLLELLRQRGLQLSWAEFVGDDPVRLQDTLSRAFHSNHVVFSCGGIGATPDDHTRACAAQALNEPLRLHPEGAELIHERGREVAAEKGTVYDPEHPNNIHRLNMAVFPESATLIPNPYNKIAGFSCQGAGGGAIHFLPGFPVMAWPMMAWVLDTYYSAWFNQSTYTERSVIVKEGSEAALTPLMLRIEQEHPGIKIFSLPSVNHPVHGIHIDLGVKGPEPLVQAAYAQLMEALRGMKHLQLGPELVRTSHPTQS